MVFEDKSWDITLVDFHRNKFLREKVHTSLLQRTRFATSDVDVVLCKLVLNDLSFTKIYFQGTKLD